MNGPSLRLALGCGLVSLSALAETPTIRFGLEAQYSPFESKSDSGQLQGFDIEIGNAVCAAAHMTCKWVETSFDGLIPGLQGRRFDAINSAMTASEKRRQVIDFTTEIYRLPTQLMARTSSGLEATPESLKGLRVGILKASIQETYAMSYWRPAGVDVVAYENQNQIYGDLVAGKLDATLVLVPAGKNAFLSRPNGEGFGFVGKPVRDDLILGNGVAFGIRKGDGALLNRLNTAIAKIRADGTLKALAQKYFGDIDVSTK